MINIMCDMETMGVGIDPAIMQIAMVAFDKDGKELGYINLHVSLASSILAGLSVKQSTVDFWQGQSDAAKEIIEDGQIEAMPLSDAIDIVDDFLRHWRSESDDGSILLWGNGSTSDNVWLMSAYKAVGLDLEDVIKHNEHKCFRQAMSDCYYHFEINPRWALKFEGTEHDALADARHQVKALLCWWDLRSSFDIDWDRAENVSAKYGISLNQC